MPSKSNLSKRGRLDLQISSEQKKKFSCEICDKSFAQKTKLGDHISAIHEGKKPFKCDICDYSCSRKDQLERHLTSVHDGKKAVLV